MIYPPEWEDFMKSDEYEKINKIMHENGWKFRLTLQSGVTVVEPIKDKAETSK